MKLPQIAMKPSSGRGHRIESAGDGKEQRAPLPNLHLPLLPLPSGGKVVATSQAALPPVVVASAAPAVATRVAVPSSSALPPALRLALEPLALPAPTGRTDGSIGRVAWTPRGGSRAAAIDAADAHGGAPAQPVWLDKTSASDVRAEHVTQVGSARNGSGAGSFSGGTRSATGGTGSLSMATASERGQRLYSDLLLRQGSEHTPVALRSPNSGRPRARAEPGSIAASVRHWCTTGQLTE